MKCNAARPFGPDIDRLPGIRVNSIRGAVYLLTFHALVACACMPFATQQRDTESEYSALASVESAAHITTATNFDQARQRLIARDFAIVMAQIPGLSDAGQSFVVQSGRTEDDSFAGLLSSALSSQGLSISPLTNPGSTGPARTIEFDIARRVSKDRQESQGIQVVSEYSVFFGNVGLRRAYVLDNRGVLRPDSPMMARGVENTALVTDDSIFTSADIATPQITQATPSVTGSETGRANREPALDQRSRLGLPTYEQTINFKELGQSNYSQLFANFSVREEHVLVFGNNSSELSAQNEQTLQKLLTDFDPRLDIVSVIGTSHGRGPYTGAQQDLAIARTATVADAIRQLGVDQSSVFAESSWSESYYDEVMPRKGAVIRVLRRQAS